MSVASLYGLGVLEPLLWLVIFILCARCRQPRAGKIILHGFPVSVVNGI
jgi:hypothetical protein